ncbi:MAG: molybdopterin-dependent oxidoreductase, partial [Mycobacteriaceae bacterium]|nr:molybdopterin-dependent oxidoreductase [Mycobacteriaceae bacterium]
MTPPTVRRATCNLCEAICGIEVTGTAASVDRVNGDPADPLSHGYLCPKSVALIDIHHDTDRLRTPLRRRGSDWEPIGWDEAIELVARELVRIRRSHGADAVAAYYGNPVVHSLGAMTHGTLFGSLLRTANRFSATSCDQLPHQVVSYLLYGHQLVLPEPDLERTAHLLVFGANPLASNGSMLTAPGMAKRLRAIRERGGRVVLFDPRRTETAAAVDEHVFVRPGTDAAVLLGMLNVVLAENPELPDYLDGAAEMQAAIAEFTPEAAARFSGVPAETIERLALEFAASPAAACYGRIGVSTQRFGTLCHWAIQLLNLVTGNLGREGGTLVPDPAADVRRTIGPGGPLGRRRSRVRGLPSFAGEFPAATMADEITTPGAGQVRALVTVSGNPVLSTPGGHRLDAALEQLEFMVAVDFYLNETTRHADVILPPTSALERDHYDLVFRAFAVRNTAKFTPALFPKQPGAKHDWEIF